MKRRYVILVGFLSIIYFKKFFLNYSMGFTEQQTEFTMKDLNQFEELTKQEPPENQIEKQEWLEKMQAAHETLSNPGVIAQFLEGGTEQKQLEMVERVHNIQQQLANIIAKHQLLELEEPTLDFKEIKEKAIEGLTASLERPGVPEPSTAQKPVEEKRLSRLERLKEVFTRAIEKVKEIIRDVAHFFAPKGEIQKWTAKIDSLLNDAASLMQEAQTTQQQVEFMNSQMSEIQKYLTNIKDRASIPDPNDLRILTGPIVSEIARVNNPIIERFIVQLENLTTIKPGEREISLVDLSELRQAVENMVILHEFASDVTREQLQQLGTKINEVLSNIKFALPEFEIVEVPEAEGGKGELKLPPQAKFIAKFISDSQFILAALDEMGVKTSVTVFRELEEAAQAKKKARSKNR